MELRRYQIESICPKSAYLYEKNERSKKEVRNWVIMV